MKNFTIKNFRVFDADGATFDMAPLTILTGCNSSGKSSFTKFWMLIQTLMKEIAEDISKNQLKNFDDYFVNFTQGHHKLGSFESIVNWNSQDKEVTFEYDTITYSALGRTLHVSITFAPRQIISQKTNLNDFFGSATKKGNSNAAKNKEQSLFAEIKSIKISDSDFGLIYEYSNRSGVFHFSEGLRHLLNEISRALDFKNAIDKILNSCIEAEEGFPYSSDYREHDLDSIKNAYGEEKLTLLHNFFEWAKEILPSQLKKLIDAHSLKNINRDDSDEIDWKQAEFSHIDSYGFFYPMKFIKELDTLTKEQILDWVNINIKEKSKGKWYDVPKFYDRIDFIFDKFINSQFDKFSDFWSYYELEVFKEHHSSFGTNDNIARGGFFSGTACEMEPWCGNKYEKDWNWDNLSPAAFFYEMFDCLSGFAQYSDISMMYSVGEISYPARDVMLEITECICLEALATVREIANAQFVEIDRSNTQRIYTFGNQGTNFNTTLSSYIQTPEKIRYQVDNNSNNWSTYIKGTFMNNWLKNLTDYSEAIFEMAPEGVGLYAMLRKKGSKNKNVLLADLGYGLTPLISMLIRVELMICEILESKGEKAILFIEEPESNLHPNLQARLAEVFIDAIKNYPIKFVLETHSEYLIRKLQLLVAKKSANKDDISIVYISDSNPKKRGENEPQVKHIKIKENGGLTAKFGTGFFDAAITLSTELFK